MAIHKKVQLVLENKFDPLACKHVMNGAHVVLHCHHYTTLYSQLAEDCGMLDGKKLLSEVAEDTFYSLLTSYYQKHGIVDLQDKVHLAEDYYVALGLGKMKILCAGNESGEAELTHSHIDEGWIKKWGKRDRPVNFITWGYLAALFAALFDLPKRSFQVEELESIVSGAEKSLFNVVAK